MCIHKILWQVQGHPYFASLMLVWGIVKVILIGLKKLRSSTKNTHML